VLHVPVLCTRNNTDGNKFAILSGIACYCGDISIEFARICYKYLILFTHSSIAEMVGGSAMNSHSGGGSLGTSGSIVMATGGGLGGAWGKRIIAVGDYTV